jgi:predicted ArsR family transcriptional regulator
MTKVSKAIAHLKNHPEGVSWGNMAKWLNTSYDGVRALMSQVRKEGYVVYANKGGFDDQGRQRQTSYRIGTPTKEMVAFYYNHVGAKRGPVAAR